MPVRIQRKRTKGYRMPEGAVYVGRPTAWGNPFFVGHPISEGGEIVKDRAEAVALYRLWVDDCANRGVPLCLPWLRGKDLACWCPLDQPCHADILLELANN